MTRNVDRRGANDNLAYHARFAASFDGGLTFSPGVQVSAAPNDPKAQRDGEPFSVTGGDHRHALGTAVSIDAGIEHPVLRGESRTIAGLRAHQRHSGPHGGRLHPLGASRSFAPPGVHTARGRLPLGIGGCGRR